MIEKMSANLASVALLCRGLVWVCVSSLLPFSSDEVCEKVLVAYKCLLFEKVKIQENSCEAGILCNDQVG